MLASSGLPLLGLTQPAWADDTADGNTGNRVEEILVTAQKREQALKDVPVSITAIGSDELEALRVNTVEDYIFQIPNASFVDSGGYYGKNVTLRGISNFSGGEYDVISVLIDDIGYSAISSASVLSTQLLDIERIEVLRGPQGTLNGRNSLGGSINIITKKPDPSGFAGSASFGLARFNTQDGKLVLNTPLADGLALRTSAYVEHSDGAVENIGPAGGSSGYDNFGGRAALRYEGLPGLTIDAAFSYEDLDRGMDDWITHDFTDPDFQEAMTSALASWGGAYPGAIDYFSDVGNNGGTVSKDVREYTRIKDWLFSTHIAYEAGAHKFELLYGHFDYSVKQTEDYDQTEYAWWRAYPQTRDDNSDSLELRASSDYDGPVNWVAGLSYFDEEERNTSAQELGIWAIEGGTPRLGGEGGYKPTYLYEGVNRLKSIGAFANLFWDITPALHLSLGGRFSRETTRIGDHYVYDAVSTEVTLDPLSSEDFRKKVKLNEFSPRIALSYDISDAITAYAQFATGYRAGYGNDALSISVGAPESVEAEHLKNYEVGIKGSLFDGAVRFSAAAFYMDYTNLQVEAPIPQEDNPYSWTIYYDLNAGEAHTQGFELETQARLTENFSLQGSVGYTDAVIDHVTLDGVDYAGIAIPNVRPWTVAASAIYERTLDADTTLNLRMDYHFQDKMQWQQVLPDPDYMLPSFQTVDISATVKHKRATVSAYFENVLNEKYYTSVGWVTVGYRGRMVHTPPRMFGLRFGYDF